MSIPPVLMQRGVTNESQSIEMTTTRLTPNATSDFQTRWQLPNLGDILDSNSAVVWSISWEDYVAATTDELVLLKNFSGGLNTIKRARFYIDGKEIFSSEDPGQIIHVSNLGRNPDYQEEILDMELGSVHGYFSAANGKFELGQDCPSKTDQRTDILTQYNRYARALGSYSTNPASNKAIECSVLLSDLFSGLQSVQLPLKIGQLVLEIEWETGFGEVAYVASAPSGAITSSRQNISIKNPVLLLDYLSFDEETSGALKDALVNGMAVPFLHTSVSSKVIPQNPAATSQTTDIHLALQGKLLMKIVVSHRLNDTNLAETNQAPQIGCGRCRSQINDTGHTISVKGWEYNLFINDLALHDQPVDTASSQYSFLSSSMGAPASIIPGVFESNLIFDDAATNTDVNSDFYTVSGITLPATNGVQANQVRDMVAGTQAYIGFDLSDMPKGSGTRGGIVIPSDAGFRSGSAPVILRISQTGSATADSQFARAKTVQVMASEVRILQVRGGIAEILEA